MLLACLQVQDLPSALFDVAEMLDTNLVVITTLFLTETEQNEDIKFQTKTMYYFHCIGCSLYAQDGCRDYIEKWMPESESSTQ
jgi:hypothetical protein